MAFIMLEQPILKRRQFEKVTLLGKPFSLAAAIRTVCGNGRIALGRVRLTRNAIPAGIRTFVHVSVRLRARVKLRDARVVPPLGRADKPVELNADGFPQIDVLRVDAVRQRLRSYAL